MLSLPAAALGFMVTGTTSALAQVVLPPVGAPAPATSQATAPVAAAPATPAQPDTAETGERPIVIVLPQFPPATPAGTSGAEQAAPANGDIVVSGRAKAKSDPLAEINAKSYEAIQSVDKAVVGPVAMGYKKGLPKPIRLGLRNFLRNLEEPVIFVNYLLQLKPGRALKTAGRFAINSTVGVAGLVDVAKKKPFNLPYTPNGFANTFACYGIGPGPYFFLPLVGPITLRDLIGLGIDKAALPAVVGPPLSKPYYAIPSATIDALNDRIEIDDQLKTLRENSSDPYVATRELYLKQRRSEIAAICGKGKIDPSLPPRPGKGKD